jgi:NAD(P)-dependent dehydrogenase (short-subunit alcohol dehydrogenase family)
MRERRVRDSDEGRLPLRGKVALVTGGAGDIGMAVLARLAALGASAVSADRRPLPADASALAAPETDISDPDSVDALFRWLDRTYGKLDILVNNAAEFDASDIAACSGKDWHRVLGTNLDGHYHVARQAVTLMRRGGEGGSVVSVVSVAGLVGVGQRAAYAASKGALIALTRQMAVDFAGDRIRVNAVAPALVDAGPFRRSDAYRRDPAAARAAAMATIPLTRASGRMIEADDVAHAIAFLASPSAAMITGVVLPVDAGLTAS